MIARRHRSLPEIRARAKAELRRNTTIQVYGWLHGAEHRRRPAYPWAQLGQAFLSIRVAAEGFSEALQAAVAAMPAPRRARVGLLPPARPPRLLSVADSLSPAPRHPDLDRFDQAVADYEAQADAETSESSGFEQKIEDPK